LEAVESADLDFGWRNTDGLRPPQNKVWEAVKSADLDFGWSDAYGLRPPQINTIREAVGTAEM